MRLIDLKLMSGDFQEKLKKTSTLDGVLLILKKISIS
jgi:hypothetical protein